MIEKIDLSRFGVKDRDADGAIVIKPSDGELFVGGIKPVKDNYLVMDVTSDSKRSSAVTWGFNENGSDGYIGFKMGLLPGLRTRLAVSFSLLDGSSLFLPRTPGKLKTVTMGRPIKLGEVDGFKLTFSGSDPDARLILHSAYITDSEPDYPLEERPMVDELGQKLNAEWKGKTHGVDELRAYLRSEYEKPLEPMSGRDVWGGDSSIRFEATGYFATRFDGRRWWLVTPDGNAFFSIGLDCVAVDGDCNLSGITGLTTSLPPKGSVGWNEGYGGWKIEAFSWHKANLYRAFGDGWFEKWADMTKKRMLHWGFNTIACWSDSEYIKREKQPYVFIFRGYPHTSKNIFRDFPDVFSAEYSESAKQWAAQLEPLTDDRALIGYFMSNEPQWAFVNSLNIARTMLGDPYPYESKHALILFLRARYRDISSLNQAWGMSLDDFSDLMEPSKLPEPGDAEDKDLWDFSAEMVREYIRIPAEAAKKTDPNHLNLGIRYAWLSSDILTCGSEYFDIFSFNCYQPDPTDAIENTLKHIKKPLIIGEFHFGALDRGLDASGLRRVGTQAERGVAYRYYMHRAASNPYCVGAHYFTLNDQAYLGRFDGENYQIGVIDVCNRPYDEFADAVTKTNSELYKVANGELPPTEEKAAQLPPIAF